MTTKTILFNRWIKLDALFSRATDDATRRRIEKIRGKMLNKLCK